MKLLPCNSEISHLKVAEKLLDEGVTMIRLLRNRPGVELPEFLNTPIVNLNFSYRYGIEDFEVDERGIRASLSFRGVAHFCDIPWTAVCAIMSEKTDQIFVWLNIFEKEEIQTYMPPQLSSMFDEAQNSSMLDEFPELAEFTFTDDEDDADENEDDDDVPPGGFTPLHFV